MKSKLVPQCEWLQFVVSQELPDGCILWRFRKDADGYGRINFDGKVRGAHRVAYFLHYGHWPIPCCLHTCDTPGCVNPKHLFEGTIQDNSRDCVAKGRNAKGTMQPQAKLTEEEVVRARQEYREGVLGFEALSKKYGVSKFAMKLAIRGNTHWKHVGVGVGKIWEAGRRRQNHCKRGHSLTPDNCYVYGNSRQCKICAFEKCKARRAKLKSEGESKGSLGEKMKVAHGKT